jgi:hypothetical protein
MQVAVEETGVEAVPRPGRIDHFNLDRWRTEDLFPLPGDHPILSQLDQNQGRQLGQAGQSLCDLTRPGQVLRLSVIGGKDIHRTDRLDHPSISQGGFVRLAVHISGKDSEAGADGVRPRIEESASQDQGACHAPQLNPIHSVGADGVRPGVVEDPTLRRLPRSLSSFVAGFKASVTSRARRELNMADIWQSNNYDHIIRNEQDFLNIWNDIDTNPQGWQEDQLHSSVPANRFNQE